MKVAAIICEYNPFHNGHLYQINKIKEELGVKHILALMSSSFVQRGEASILDKYEKARLAVENGVSLVAELPSFLAVQSAENFGQGSVKILKNLNVIDYLVFGSESSLDELVEIREKIKNEEDKYNSIISKNIKEGKSYSEGFFDFLKANKLGENFGSNDILALEYLKELGDSQIKAYSVKRYKSLYNSHEAKSGIASASFIRQKVLDKKTKEVQDLVPKNVYEVLSQLSSDEIPSLDDYFDILLYKIFVSQDKMDQIINYENGMDNLIKNNLIESKSVNELIEKCTSKRYSRSRIQRFILSYLLEITEESYKKSLASLYIRPLAFDARGLEILGLIKENSNIPLVSKFSNAFDKENYLLEKELRASNLYNLKKLKLNEDFYISPIKI